MSYFKTEKQIESELVEVVVPVARSNGSIEHVRTFSGSITDRDFLVKEGIVTSEQLVEWAEAWEADGKYSFTECYVNVIDYAVQSAKQAI